MSNSIPWRDFSVVSASVAVVGLGLGVTSPLITLVLDERGHGSAVIGALTAIGSLGVVFGAWLAPRWHGSTRTGLMVATLLAAISTLLIDASPNLVWWSALRLLFGVAMGLLFTTSEAAINTLAQASSRGRLVALYTTAFTVCQLLGPTLVAGLRSALAWPFVASGLVFLLPLPLLAMMREPPTSSPHEAGASWRSVWPNMGVIVLGTAFFAFYDTLALALLPLFVMKHGLTVELGLLSASVTLIGDALLQLPLGWLADRYGRARVHAGCGVLVALLLPVMPLAVGSLWLWWPYLFVLGGAAGGVYTLAMVACGERFSGRALVAASGMISATWGVASLVAPLGAGALMQVWSADGLVWVLWLGIAMFLAAVWRERRLLGRELASTEVSK